MPATLIIRRLRKFTGLSKIFSYRVNVNISHVNPCIHVFHVSFFLSLTIRNIFFPKQLISTQKPPQFPQFPIISIVYISAVFVSKRSFLIPHFVPFTITPCASPSASFSHLGLSNSPLHPDAAFQNSASCRPTPAQSTKPPSKKRSIGLLHVVPRCISIRAKNPIPSIPASSLN